MAKKARSQGLQEERTRVTLFLPAHEIGDMDAVRSIIHYLRTQRTSRQCPITGFTNSNYPDCVLRGTWWSARRSQWVLEKVALVIMDYAKPLGEVALEDALTRLNRVILSNYKHFGREQESIWMIAERVLRFK